MPYFAIIACTTTQLPDNFAEKVGKLSWLHGVAWKRGQSIALAGELGSSAPKKRLQKELNPKQGTIGKLFSTPLPISEMWQSGCSFSSYFRDYTIIKDTDACAQPSAGLAAVVPSAASAPCARAASVDHYTTLGLCTGASAEEVQAAYRREALVWHPDKPTGNVARFIAAKDACETLLGVAPAVEECRAMTVAPRAPGNAVPCTCERKAGRVQCKCTSAKDLAELAKSLRKSCSPGDVEEQTKAWAAYATALKWELEAANNMLQMLSEVRQIDAREAKRVQAVEYLAQFKRSARYWEPAAIRRWFAAPEITTRGIPCVDSAQDWRQGNEDLDPCVHFLRFIHEGVGYAKKLVIKMGLDIRTRSITASF